MLSIAGKSARLAGSPDFERDYTVVYAVIGLLVIAGAVFLIKEKGVGFPEH
jgi:hypothetical protein